MVAKFCEEMIKFEIWTGFVWLVSKAGKYLRTWLTGCVSTGQVLRARFR